MTHLGVALVVRAYAQVLKVLLKVRFDSSQGEYSEVSGGGT